MLKKIGLISLLSVSLMSMNSVEINVNDVDLEAGLTLDIGQFNYSVEPETSFIGIKYLKSDKDYSDFNNSESYMEASFMREKAIGKNGFYIGLGIKANYIKSTQFVASSDENRTTTADDTNTTTSNTDTNTTTTTTNYGAFLSVPFIFKVGYKLPNYPVDIHASVAFAPQVLSFKNAKAYSEYRIGMEIYLIENAAVSLGYRSLKLKYQDTNDYKKYNGSVYGGFYYRF